MRIVRIDFLGFTVKGADGRVSQSSYAASGVNAWPGFSACPEDHLVVLEGKGRRIELPRARCVVEWGPDAVEAQPVKRGPGRPPKQPQPETAA